jgi:hypothetical protein
MLKTQNDVLFADAVFLIVKKMLEKEIVVGNYYIEHIHVLKMMVGMLEHIDCGKYMNLLIAKLAQGLFLPTTGMLVQCVPRAYVCMLL